MALAGFSRQAKPLATKSIPQMSHFCNIIFMMHYCYIHLVQ